MFFVKTLVVFLLFGTNVFLFPVSTENTSSLDAKYETEHEEVVGYSVEFVIDGDTIIVSMDGRSEKVRLLGIDTPEKTGGFRTVGCFGDDASEYMKNLLYGKRVILLWDGNRDKYDRILAYVFSNGRDIGAHLIEQGYAFAYRKFSHDREVYYLELERKAKKNKTGMWSQENCGYWGQSS
jgi:micrococcal nuclease